MGKRTDFPRIPRDLYETPWEPVVALSPYLDDVEGFAEPCCGRGALIQHLERLGHVCRWASDVEPGMELDDAEIMDALTLVETDLSGCTHVITNPPWPAKHGRGEPTLSLIRHLSSLRPTWLLLAADFAHNGYAAEVLRYCTRIVSVGRVRWMPGTKMDGYENAAWYKFDQDINPAVTMFHGAGDGVPRYARGVEEMLS